MNTMYPLTNRLIEISRDGRISDDEIPDFAKIQHNLEQVSLATNALHLWVECTISENEINKELLEENRKNSGKIPLTVCYNSLFPHPA